MINSLKNKIKIIYRILTYIYSNNINLKHLIRRKWFIFFKILILITIFLYKLINHINSIIFYKPKARNSSSVIFLKVKIMSKVGTKNDIVFEILCRLPTRSVVRFKSVSKLWHSIISDPYLITTHTHCYDPYNIAGFIYRSKNYYHFVSFNNTPTSVPDLSLTILQHDAENIFGHNVMVDVFRSFFGLLICPGYFLSEYGSKFHYHLMVLIYIYNPVTKHFKRLPGLRGQFFLLDVILTPDKKLFCLSMGGSYKHPGGGGGWHDCHISMYSSITESWKNICMYIHDS